MRTLSLRKLYEATQLVAKLGLELRMLGNRAHIRSTASTAGPAQASGLTNPSSYALLPLSGLSQKVWGTLLPIQGGVGQKREVWIVDLKS